MRRTETGWCRDTWAASMAILHGDRMGSGDLQKRITGPDFIPQMGRDTGHPLPSCLFWCPGRPETRYFGGAGGWGATTSPLSWTLAPGCCGTAWPPAPSPKPHLAGAQALSLGELPRDQPQSPRGGDESPVLKIKRLKP